MLILVSVLILSLAELDVELLMRMD